MFSPWFKFVDTFPCVVKTEPKFMKFYNEERAGSDLEDVVPLNDW